MQRPVIRYQQIVASQLASGPCNHNIANESPTVINDAIDIYKRPKEDQCVELFVIR